MKNKKGTLITIIVLLIIFLPLSIFSTVLHIKVKNPVIDNPNHEFFYNNKLYFYDNDNLLGTYNCQSGDYCDYAPMRNNSEYLLDEVKIQPNTKFTLINNRYAFLMDTVITNLSDADIILYDIETEHEMGRYKSVKNYGVGINQGEYIVQNKDGYYGVLQFYDGVQLRIPFTEQYEYMGVCQDDFFDKTMTNQLFAVFKNNVWYLIDDNNNVNSSEFANPIVSYNDNYVITKENDLMNIYTTSHTLVLNGSFSYLDFWANYLAVIENNEFYIYNMNTKEIISLKYPVNSQEDISYKIENNHLLVYVNDEIKENIAIR